MGASPGSTHIMNLEDYQVNFHVSTSMRKGGVGGGGGNRRHWFDKYSSRFVYVPGTADRVMGKKEGLSSPSL